MEASVKANMASGRLAVSVGLWTMAVLVAVGTYLVEGGDAASLSRFSYGRSSGSDQNSCTVASTLLLVGMVRDVQIYIATCAECTRNRRFRVNLVHPYSVSRPVTQESGYTWISSDHSWRAAVAIGMC